MLMTAALQFHMDSAYGHGPSPSSASAAPPPWLPNHGHQILHDFTASAPSPTHATATAPNHHHHLRPTAAPAARRVAKRRPRPSRKLPTTYISADPASFRRMVHQVTGADDLPMIPPTTPETLICRPTPSRHAGAAGALMLPTLDTSAFLIGAPPRVAARTDDAPCAGSAGLDQQVEAGGAGVGAAVGACDYSSNSGSSCGGFPTLDSWDALF